MDSNNSLSAVARGDSNTPTIAVLVSRAWELIRRFRIRAWFSMVPPKLNPPDLPTRGKRLPFSPARSSLFRAMSALYRLRLATARAQISADTHRFHEQPNVALLGVLEGNCYLSILYRE